MDSTTERMVGEKVTTRTGPRPPTQSVGPGCLSLFLPYTFGPWGPGQKVTRTFGVGTDFRTTDTSGDGVPRKWGSSLTDYPGT